MIKNIVFDFGKVLIDYDYPALLSSIFTDPEELKEFSGIFCSVEFCNLCDTGDTPFWEIVCQYRQKYPKWDRQIAEFWERQLDAMTGEIPGMRDLLFRLRKRGYRLYGLTNWSETVYPVIEKFDILSLLDGRLISSEEHLIKPDVAIYRRLCDKFGLVPEECLFTDDKQINVDGALAAGMDAVLFKDEARFEKDLMARNLL